METTVWHDEPVVGQTVRVDLAGPGYLTPASGTYLGVLRDEEDGEPMHYFVNGEMGGAPQRCFGFRAAPGTSVTDERTPTAAIHAALGIPEHDCWEYPVPYVSDGPLGHGWECGKCGALLQVG